MKRRVLLFLVTYVLFILIFIVQKPLFMLFYWKLFGETFASEWWRVIVHGLPLDLSMAGYLTIVPGLLIASSIWIGKKWIKGLLRGYFLLISILLSTIFVLDLGLYQHWGFRLDTTPLFYFFSSPSDAMASMEFSEMWQGIVAWILFALASCALLFATVRLVEKMQQPAHKIAMTSVMVLLTALLFIPIRGGFSVSTMNIGKVYFSDIQQLNHAAINPAFSLLESASRQTNFGDQYRFMSAESADILFNELTDKPVTDSIPSLFTVKQPNVVFIILESFSNYLFESLGGEPIAVELDEVAKEGVLFTNLFANSFRTDRGLVSIFSGYPAQPTTSIMKYARKTQSLPSIPASLKSVGYAPYYYYGGDADFTNMRSYLMSMGMEDIVCDKDFPLSERLSKWGAHDEVVFQRLFTDIKDDKLKEPFIVALQTSSSHEPFEVPFSKFEDKRLNAFAYADSCTGDFIRSFCSLPLWDESIVLLVSDHLGGYPNNINTRSSERYRIPLIITGGAVRQPIRIDNYGSQIDIAATLLYQLGIPHEEFIFSKNILNPDSPHFGYFTSPNYFGMVTPNNEVVYDCDASQVILDSGDALGSNLEPGKAMLQKLYDDLSKR